MKAGRQYRLYPTAEEEKRLDKVFRACNFVWNWYLGWRYLGLFISRIRKLLSEESDFRTEIEKGFLAEIRRSVNRQIWSKIKDKTLSESLELVPDGRPGSRLLLVQDCFQTCRGVLTKELVNNWLADFCSDMGLPLDHNLKPLEIQGKLTDLKSQSPWLFDVPSQALVGEYRNAEETFQRWFKGICKAPRFKGKFDRRGSFSQQNNLAKPRKDGSLSPLQNRIEWSGGKMALLTIPKFPGLKMRLHRPVGGPIGTVTISRTSTGEYFASFPIEIDIEPPRLKVTKDNARGYDVGLSQFITNDLGEIIDPGLFRDPKLEAKRLFLQRLLQKKRDRSPRWKTSKRYQQTKRRLAKVEQLIARRRSDFIHKQTYRIANDEKMVLFGCEDLGIKGMLKNKKLARSISNAGWYEFRRQMDYKAPIRGKVVQAVSKTFPSSKLCSACGHKNSDLKLSDREWVCPKCGAKHRRDHNAGKNIAAEALRLYKEKMKSQSDAGPRSPTQNKARRPQGRRPSA